MGKLLHIYGPVCPRAEAIIVGTKEGLEALREAIDTALASASAARMFTASDKDRYPVVVLQVEEDAVSFLPVPYIAHPYQDGDKYRWESLLVTSEKVRHEEPTDAGGTRRVMRNDQRDADGKLPNPPGMTLGSFLRDSGCLDPPAATESA